MNAPAEKKFFKFVIEQEGNDSWNLLLEKKKYDQAYELAKKYRPEFSDQIASVLAVQLFEQKKYVEAAELFSKIHYPLERALLMYLEKVDEEIDAQYGLISRFV